MGDTSSIFKNDYYVISKDFKLIEFNDSVSSMYPGIKVGDYCYKATMKRESPCLHCPIAGNSDCDCPIYYDPFYEAWIEAIFSEIGNGLYAVSCRPAIDRGVRVFDEMGQQASKELAQKLSGGAANHLLKEMEQQLQKATDEQNSQLEEIIALNTQLEENQTRLEEAASEQEAQIEEITELNKILEAQTRFLEAQKKSDELRLDTVAEAIHGGFKITLPDQNFSFRYASTQLAQMLGYSSSEEFLTASGGTMAGTVDLEEGRREVAKALKMVARGDMYTMNYRMRCKDGSWKNVEDRGRLIRLDGEPDEYWSFIIDRDELVQKTEALESARLANQALQEAQAKLEEAKFQAEAANAAKTSFLFNMSHDIRTPMNAIIGFRELLEKHQDDPQKRMNYLRKIEESSSVLLSIINNVLEMARIEKGQLESDESAWSVEQFNDTIYSLFNELMTQKNIEFSREICVNHPYVYCDATKLREVFLNLLSNAYKYTPVGGRVTMRVEELACECEGYVLYQTTITDTGIGMSEEFLPHLFDEFSREKTTTDIGIEGTGLGMPIVKRLIDFMDGTIKVQSQQGVGTTFCVTIPHKIADRSKLTNHVGLEYDPKIFENKRLLLAEDNDLNAEIAIEILEEAGFKMERAIDGQICCDMVSQSPSGYYDLILMDIQMPNMNGYDATRTIRAMEDYEKSRIPILAMTANAFEEDRRASARAGMNGHLAKPINVKELLRELATHLGQNI